MKMQADTFDKHLNPWSFWPATIALGLFILAGVFDQEQLGAFLNGLLYGLANNLGWYINLLSPIGMGTSKLVALMRSPSTAHLTGAA